MGKCHYCTAPKPDEAKKEAADAEKLAIQNGEKLKARGYIAPTVKLNTTCGAWTDQWGSGLSTSSLTLAPAFDPKAKAAEAKAKALVAADAKKEEKAKAEAKAKAANDKKRPPSSDSEE